MVDTTLFGSDLRFHLNPDNGVISLQFGPISMQGVCQAEVSMPVESEVTLVGERAVEMFRERVNDVNGSGEMLSVRFADGPFDLGLRLEAVVYANQPYLAMRLGILNHGNERILVHRLTVLTTTRLDFSEEPLDGWVNGYHSWSFTGYVPHEQAQPHTMFGSLTMPFGHNPATGLPSRKGEYIGEWVGALIQPHQQALVAGFVGVEDQFGQVYMDGRRDKSLRLENTLDGIPFISGERVWGEWAILYRVPLPNGDPLGPYAEAVARLTPPRIPDPRPAAGWSSWYQFFDHVSAEDMDRNQQVLRNLRYQLPLDVIQLDDGYQRTWGDWLEHNRRFPDGVGAWARQVEADGFAPGLWFSPFAVERRSLVARTYPEAIITDDRGRPVNAGFLPGHRLRALDPTHPATRDYLRQTVEMMVEHWGIHYLKLDFLYAGALPGGRFDPTTTRAQALRSGLKLVREVAGDDVIIVGCGCPLGPALGLVDIMRVSPDVAPNWQPELFRSRLFARNDAHLPATRNSIGVTLQRHWTHRRWWWLDADNILVREEQKLTEEEVRTLITAAGMTGSHVMLSDDLPVTSHERLMWAASLLPQMPGELNLPTQFEETLPSLLVKRYDCAAGEHHAVALINWSDEPHSFSLARDQIGVPYGVPMLAFDFWNRRVATTQADLFDLGLVPAHGVVLLAMRQVKPGPQLAGSDLHISMGAEVTRWETTDSQLRFSLDLGREVHGTLWLKLPEPPNSATCNGEECQLQQGAHPNIYLLTLNISGQVDCVIGFGNQG